MKILVIDDSRAMRKTQIIYLRKLGVTDVTEAGDGMVGLEKIRMNPSGFDLVISDYHMPTMDGLEFMERLRGDPKTAETPVAFCSSEQDRDSIVKILKTGVVGFILKPFEEDYYYQKIREILKKLGLSAPAD